MKILYAIQGTGNGHLTRARDIIPLLQDRGEVDILISGTQADVDLPFYVKYRLRGLSFVFGKKGGIDFWGTFKRASIFSFLNEVFSISLSEYDIVINDFEPVTAWSCKLRGGKCVSLSHQSALSTSKKVPTPKHTDWFGDLIIKFYAPSKHKYGFHFQSYDKGIFTPVIREEVRKLEVHNLGHYTVYLPSYNDHKLISYLSLFPSVQWKIFSKHSKKKYRVENIEVCPIDNSAFLESMANAEGVLCGAGFETPAEALFLNKKLLVIPMKSQYEQHYNAEALKAMGISVVKSLKKKHYLKIKEWIESSNRVSVFYANQTKAILDQILAEHVAREFLATPNSKFAKA